MQMKIMLHVQILRYEEVLKIIETDTKWKKISWQTSEWEIIWHAGRLCNMY